jgi:hypothetical protein
METTHTFIYEKKGITHTISMKTTHFDTDIEEVLNLMRQYLLTIGYSDDTARRLRIVDEIDKSAEIHEVIR